MKEVKKVKNVLVIIACFIGFFLLLNWDYIYYPLKSPLLKKQIESQLEEKYQEEFHVKSMKYSKAFGDDSGVYYVQVAPKENKDISFQVGASEKGRLLDEDDEYEEASWRSEANKEWKPIMEKLGVTNYVVNIGVNQDIKKQYKHHVTYETVRKEHATQTEEYIYMADYQKPFNVNKEEQRLKELITILQERNLRGFSIEWIYYKRNLKGNPLTLRGEKWDYLWRLDTRNKNNLEELQNNHLRAFLLQSTN